MEGMYLIEQPTGARLFWTRVGLAAGLIGWACLLVAVVASLVVAPIYHALH